MKNKFALWASQMVVLATFGLTSCITQAAPTSLITPTIQPVLATTEKTVEPSGEAPVVACIGQLEPIVFIDPETLLAITTDPASGKKGVRAMSIITGQWLDRLVETGKGESIGGAVVAPDGSRMALQIDASRIQIRSYPQGKLLGEHQIPAEMLSDISAEVVSGMQFSATDQRLYVSSTNGWVYVLDKSAKLIDAFQPSGVDNLPSPVMGMGLSPNGEKFVTIPEVGYVMVWDAKTFGLLTELHGGIQGGYSGSQAAFSSDGAYLAIGLAGGGPISLFRTVDWELIWQGGLMAPALSPDAQLLAVVEVAENEGFEIVLRSTDDGAVVRAWVSHPDQMPWRLMFAPDGERLLSQDSTGLRVWQVSNGKPLLEIRAALCD